MSNCPCHSQKKYRECCAPFHLGAAPENGLLLMRSRYSAYSLGLVKYIIETTHPQSRFYCTNKQEWEGEILEFCKATVFHDLLILQHISTPTLETVTFRAILFEGGHDISFTEKSTFLRYNGRFTYFEGEIIDRSH
jgi:SEC-C motif-containing protein